jgi:hypothetical protein
VGTHEFFCWNCCLEFHGAPGNWRLFALDPDGLLVEVQPEPAGLGGVPLGVPAAAPAVHAAPEAGPTAAAG